MWWTPSSQTHSGLPWKSVAPLATFICLLAANCFLAGCIGVPYYRREILSVSPSKDGTVYFLYSASPVTKSTELFQWNPKDGAKKILDLDKAASGALRIDELGGHILVSGDGLWDFDLISKELRPINIPGFDVRTGSWSRNVGIVFSQKPTQESVFPQGQNLHLTNKALIDVTKIATDVHEGFFDLSPNRQKAVYQSVNGDKKETFSANIATVDLDSKQHNILINNSVLFCSWRDNEQILYRPVNQPYTYIYDSRDRQNRQFSSMDLVNAKADATGNNLYAILQNTDSVFPFSNAHHLTQRLVLLTADGNVEKTLIDTESLPEGPPVYAQ